MKLFQKASKTPKTFINPLEDRYRTLYSEPWVKLTLNTRTNMLELTTGVLGMGEIQKTHKLPIFLEMKGRHLESWIKSTGAPFTKNLENVCGRVCEEVTQYIKDAMVSRDKVIYSGEIEQMSKDTSDFEYTLETDHDLVTYATKIEYIIHSLDWIVEHRGCSPYGAVAKDLNVYFTAKLYEPEPHL